MMNSFCVVTVTLLFQPDFYWVLADPRDTNLNAHVFYIFFYFSKVIENLKVVFLRLFTT